MNPELVSTLRSALAENDSHSSKIQKAQAALSGFFPLTEESFPELDEMRVTVLDQFLYRFTKMQDSLGTRFLPALYSLLEDDVSPKPFLDILNRLEQLRVLESFETWQFFRDLRNRVAHDYPESLTQTVQTLNLLHSEIDRFLALYATAKEACILRLPRVTT